MGKEGGELIADVSKPSNAAVYAEGYEKPYGEVLVARGHVRWQQSADCGRFTPRCGGSSDGGCEGQREQLPVLENNETFKPS